jgi:surfeit locus 1 family protein
LDSSKTGKGTTPEQVSAATNIDQPAVPRPRSRIRLLLLAICAGIVFFGFLALGTWQVYRLQWKLNLIERVNQRVYAPAVPAPGPDRWSQVTAETEEYRHVQLHGTFLYDQTALVQAVSDYGNGYWLMTPLRAQDGSIVLINRGFIPVGESKRAAEFRNEKLDAQGRANVAGLLRISEPRGGFLRENDPAADRWYSRDVQAIAASRKLANVAPYFIDAEAVPRPASEAGKRPTDYPIAGLTVIAFHNSHLVYALTWYALALMVAGGWLWAAREKKRRVTGSQAERL